MKYPIISTDDHAWEKPDTWTSRVPAKFRDDCPQLQRREGMDYWVYAGKGVRALGTGCAAMRPDRDAVKLWDDVPAAAYDPAARLETMDQDGVGVEVLFPQASGFGGGPYVTAGGDPDLRVACIRAYNDFLAEEWGDFSPRYVPQALVPMWDVDLAVPEVKRAHDLGHKALVWTGAPQAYGFPHFNDRYWDPLWGLLQELNMPVALHIGASGGGAPLWEGFTPMRFLALVSTNAIASNIQVIANLLFSGVLDRFSELKFISVESGLGWVPYLLETADHQYRQQRLLKDGMKTKPSEYFRRNVYVNFWYEKSGIELRKAIGVDNIMWEADFPHPTSTYPDSKKLLAECLAGVPEEDQVKMLHSNAMRVYGLDSALISAACPSES